MPISPIPRHDERNYVGLCYIDVVDVKDVLTMPDDVGGNLVGAIVLRDGATWSRIYLEEPGGSFNDRWRVEKGAQLSAATISGNVSKDRLALMPILWRLKSGRYVARLQTRNGPALVMGRPECGAIGTAPERTTGEEMERDSNGYRVVFSLQHRFPVPFHNGTIPDPPQCPTLEELLPLVTWSYIRERLSEEQLADAQGSICSSLCELIDQAFATATMPTDALLVSDAAQPGVVNGVYERVDTFNGKGRYRNGSAYSSWSGTAWWVTYDGATGSYYSPDDTEHPWEATGWTPFGSFTAPVPSVEQARVPGGTPTALLACLSPDQQAILAAALGATCPTLCELIDAAIMGGGEEGGGAEDSFTVSGAGEAMFNVQFTRDGANMFRARYRNGSLVTLWNGSAWVMLDEGDGYSFYQSTDDTTYPWEATAWTMVGSYATPVPSLTQDTEGEPVDAVVVSGAGHAMAKGTYHRIGTVNARGQYQHGPIQIEWNGFRWWITDTAGGYYSEDDVEYPWEVTTWVAMDWDESLPQLEQLGASGGSGAGVGVLLDCLSPEQQEELASIIGGPPGVVMTTDGTTPVIGVASGGSANLPGSVIKYKDASNTDQVLSAGGIQIADALLRPEVQIPRRQLLLNGSGSGHYVTLADLVGNTVPALVTGTWMIHFAPGDGQTLADHVNGRQVSSTMAGTWSVSSDGSSGTLEYSIDGGGWTTLSSSITFSTSQRVRFRRSTTTAAGYIQLTR